MALRLLAAALLACVLAPAALAWPTGKPTSSYSKTYQAHRFHCQLWLFENGYVERCTIVLTPRGLAMVWNPEGSGARHTLR